MAFNEAVVAPPLVIDLGKKRKKQIKDLQRGRGKLVNRVNEAMEQVRAELGDQLEGKQIVPMVVLFQKKRKKRNRTNFPFSCGL